MVLGLLENEAQHGYQLIRRFAATSGEAYSPSPGMLYPLLTLLADMGLVEEVAGEGAGSRRSFALTAAGKAELEANRGKLAELLGKLASLAEVAGRTDSGPVRRAMMNLRTAAVQRMSRDGASDELAFELAAILDEAAQKIERLK
jgi:DNA-binding PadR family transcriptional regulator